MAKYRTKQKSKKLKQPSENYNTIEQVIEYTVDYIKQWQRDEMHQLFRNPMVDNIPIYIPVSDSNFIIGYHQVKKTHDIWELFDRRYEQTHYFRNKVTAIMFSLCRHMGNKKIADDISQFEDLIIRLNNKQKHYLALQKKYKLDAWRAEYYAILHQTNEYKISHAQAQLKKTLVQAKYLKIWNLP